MEYAIGEEPAPKGLFSGGRRLRATVVGPLGLLRLPLPGGRGGEPAAQAADHRGLHGGWPALGHSGLPLPALVGQELRVFLIGNGAVEEVVVLLKAWKENEKSGDSLVLRLNPFISYTFGFTIALRNTAPLAAG